MTLTVCFSLTISWGGAQCQCGESSVKAALVMLRIFPLGRFCADGRNLDCLLLLDHLPGWGRGNNANMVHQTKVGCGVDEESRERRAPRCVECPREMPVRVVVEAVCRHYGFRCRHSQPPDNHNAGLRSKMSMSFFEKSDISCQTYMWWCCLRPNWLARLLRSGSRT